MGKALVPDDRQLFFNPIANGQGDGPVSMLRTGIGLSLERQEGFFIAQLAKRWEDGFAESPVAVAGFGDAKGVLDRF